MIRKPIVAGQFYSSDKEELKKEVRKYLGKEKKDNIKACIVPHAGYFYSGKLAGKVISRIKEKKNFILLGVNHSGLGNKISFSSLNFETPLGIVKNNVKLGKEILEKLKKESLDVDINEEPHNYEHSLEVELPFLQLSQKDFSIIPIIFKNLSYEECKKVAKVLANFVSDNICLLISSDFTHYGYSFGFVPFSSNISKSKDFDDDQKFERTERISDIKENLYRLDKNIINSILNLDSKKVYDLASKSTVCGIYGVTILTEIAKMKRFKGKLVDYYTSGDITGDFSNCVGYTGIVFE